MSLGALRPSAAKLTRQLPPGPETYKYFLGFQSRWGDNDMYGHMNNVVYTMYVDSIVNEYLINHCKLNPAQKSADPIGLVVSSSFQYAASLSYPNPVLAALKISKLGTSSVTWDVALFAAEDVTGQSGRGRFSSEVKSASNDWTSELKIKPGTTAASWGQFVHVFATSDGTQKSVPIPESTRKALEKLLEK